MPCFPFGGGGGRALTGYSQRGTQRADGVNLSPNTSVKLISYYVWCVYVLCVVFKNFIQFNFSTEASYNCPTVHTHIHLNFLDSNKCGVCYLSMPRSKVAAKSCSMLYELCVIEKPESSQET